MNAALLAKNLPSQIKRESRSELVSRFMSQHPCWQKQNGTKQRKQCFKSNADNTERQRD